jgi:ribonuclease D
VSERSPNGASPTYIDTPGDADALLSSLARTRTLALDTEGASFHRYVDRIYLLQLSTATQHAIVDPLAVTSLEPLGRLLSDPAVEVVFHDADYDLRLLRQDYGWRVRNIFDTRVAAQLLGVKSFGLAALLDSHFGVKLDKKHQRADWSMRPLTPDMLAYAAQDTMHLIQLRDLLNDALDQKGRRAWAQEEFTRLEDTRWEEEDPQLAYLRLKGARDLTRRELAILRELHSWREEIARAQDRASFRVAGNDVLFDLARTQPDRVDALSGTKGLSRSILDRQGAAIVAAIARGRAIPEADLPRFPKSARWDRDPDFDDRVSRLKVVRDRVAAELEIDPGVLCGRERLEAIARRKPKHMDDFVEITDLRRWQAELLGADFLKALAGGARTASAEAPASVPVAAADNDSPYRGA